MNLQTAAKSCVLLDSLSRLNSPQSLTAEWWIFLFSDLINLRLKITYDFHYDTSEQEIHFSFYKSSLSRLSEVLWSPWLTLQVLVAVLIEKKKDYMWAFLKIIFYHSHGVSDLF